MSITEINKDGVPRHELDQAIDSHGHTIDDISDFPSIGVKDTATVTQPETVVLSGNYGVFPFIIASDLGTITIKLDNLEELGRIITIVGLATHIGVSGTLDIEVRDSDNNLVTSISLNSGETEKQFILEPVCFGVANWYNKLNYKQP